MQFKILTLCLALFATCLHAQIQSPPASPGVKMETTVGLTDVSLEYSRPGMKGRTLFANDGLVPHGELWRTGANQATKITFGDAMKIGGEEVPAGTYAILTRPAADQWEVLFYNYAGGSWMAYAEQDPAVSVTAEVQETDDEVETFTIDVTNYTMDGAELVMKWGNTMVAVPLESNARESVMATIDRVMAGPSMNDYFQAASFLAATGDDTEKALEYAQKANEMAGENQRYWMVRLEAVLLGELGKTDAAIEAAKKSKKLAEEAGNMDFVRMNEASIEEWSM